MINDDALNAAEAASILHVGRNAVYELAKSGRLPSYKVGRKVLFSLKDVQAYLESMRTGGVEGANKGQPEDASSADAASGKPGAGAPLSPHGEPPDTFVIAGQGLAADLLVDRLQTLGSQAVHKRCESYTGLVDVYEGRANATLVHLYDQRTNSYNIPYVQRLAPGTPVMVFRLVKRWQGFAVAKRNPKSISSWGALLRDDMRLANRQRGCGSRILLDEKLISMESEPWALKGYENDFPSGLAAARAVASDLADVAVVSEQTAAQTDGVDFVRLQPEWLDIVGAKGGRGRELCRALKAFFDDAAFKREYARIVQGDAENLGAIVYGC